MRNGQSITRMSDFKKYLRISIGCLAAFIFVTTQFSCKKFLDKKPKESLAVPNTLNDLEALLNHPGYGSPNLELVADDYYVTDATWALGEGESKRYAWQDGIQFQQEQADWSSLYKEIFTMNLVLDQFNKISIETSERTRANIIKGSALFGRAFKFYVLAQLYCRPYSSTASSDPGIVLRLTPNMEDRVFRSTVDQTYTQILADLKEAAELVPSTAAFKTLPNKAAAYGMLARVYLTMGDYTNALLYSNKSLESNNTLLDYNTLNGTGSFELPQDFLVNPEVSFAQSAGISFTNYPKAIVDSNLYRSYSPDDLRQTVFFGTYGNDKFYFRGSYFQRNNFTTPIFLGIATDEMYLIRAEANARLQNKDAALADLNFLLRHRYKTGTYTDATATDAQQALNLILAERRKELLFRGLRWTDLRRYNLENRNITIKRLINGDTLSLPPGDPRWVLLIPVFEIDRSGIQQNPR